MPARRRDAPPLLDPRLDELPFLPGFVDLAAKAGATTLRQIARIPPSLLVAQPGSATIAHARAIVENFLGRTWEELASVTPPSTPPPDAAPRMPTSWDELRLVLPGGLAAARLDDVDLPALMVSHANREGLETLGDLAAWSAKRLVASRSIERLTVRRTFVAVSRFAARTGVVVRMPPPAPIDPPGSIPPPAPARRAGAARPPAQPPAGAARPAQRRRAPLGLLEAWKARLQALPAEHRRAMELHAGIDGGRPLVSADVAAQMGVSRAKARRLDREAVEVLARDRAWMEEVKAHFGAALRAPRVRLAKLAGDPWWAEAVLVPRALDYFAQRVLEAAVVLDQGKTLYLAQWTKGGSWEGD